MKQLYAAKANSPVTGLSAAITAAATTIAVIDKSVLTDAPGIATIGTGDQCETITYTSISGNILMGVTRGVNGVASVGRPVRLCVVYSRRTITDALLNVPKQLISCWTARPS